MLLYETGIDPSGSMSLFDGASLVFLEPLFNNWLDGSDDWG